MNRSGSFFFQIIVLFGLFSLVMGGCSHKQDAQSQPIKAIDTIRTQLELPEVPLEFVENTTMINSPGGDLKVALYQDSEGRKFYVEPETNQVVEIDARSLLANFPRSPEGEPDAGIKAKAMQYMAAIIPDFASRQSQWSYEEGNKGDNYFFSWYGEMKAGSMNRPFAQIGLHKSGILFAYYNTLMFAK